MDAKSPQKKTGTLRYMWNHKLVLFLLLVIIIGAGWWAVKYLSLRHSFNKEKQHLASVFIDENTRVFSWAVRSELLRDNRDQINQFFMSLVKEPGYKKIQLIDINSSKVIVSTNKKDEGKVISDTSILNTNNVKQLPDDHFIRCIAPVMGLNSKVAVLVIDRTIPGE
jgi:hypothetical protein